MKNAAGSQSQLADVKRSLVTATKSSVGLSESTEVTAQISVPHDGGWGWVVVLAAFWCIFILDGSVFTFGSVLKDMTDELGVFIYLYCFLYGT